MISLLDNCVPGDGHCWYGSPEHIAVANRATANWSAEFEEAQRKPSTMLDPQAPSSTVDSASYMEVCQVSAPTQVLYWYLVRAEMDGYWDCWAPELRVYASGTTRMEAIEGCKEAIADSHEVWLELRWEVPRPALLAPKESGYCKAKLAEIFV